MKDTESHKWKLCSNVTDKGISLDGSKSLSKLISSTQYMIKLHFHVKTFFFYQQVRKEKSITGNQVVTWIHNSPMKEIVYLVIYVDDKVISKKAF